MGGRLLLVWLALAALPAAAGDWPQILGPERRGVAAGDERIADRWPAAGPPVHWRREVGSGYAGVAVAGDRVALFHRQGDREIIAALDVATGKPLWEAGHPTTFRPQVGGGDGPLCAPVIHAGLVITQGAQGVLSA
ncbi:MAG: alcohol dehydrogenase, partial [Planctomycetia bacterium]